ncbi:hypothetical protein [Erwinia phage Pecta]|nr:hypothetical protein [Erwinia phage Pecta]
MKVYIVGTPFHHYFEEMFSSRGHEIVKTIAEADVVQFTGGEDISPSLYGEHEHQYSGPNERRDRLEIAAYEEARELGKFCAGVCRGGQLLNVLSGGSMYQHVSSHSSGSGHGAVDVETGDVFPVSSLHHQMMILGDGGKLLAKSQDVRSKVKLGMTRLGSKRAEEVVTTDDEVEVEACYYPATRSFCYQPHPEFVTPDHPCRNYYFKKLEQLLQA